MIYKLYNQNIYVYLYVFVQMAIPIKVYIMLYICMNISLVLSNDVLVVPYTGPIYLSSINHITKTNGHLCAFMSMFIWIMSCVMLYFHTKISLVLWKLSSEITYTGMMYLSYINQITKINQHLYVFVKIFTSNMVCIMLYIYRDIPSIL